MGPLIDEMREEESSVQEGNVEENVSSRG